MFGALNVVATEGAQQSRRGVELGGELRVRMEAGGEGSREATQHGVIGHTESRVRWKSAMLTWVVADSGSCVFFAIAKVECSEA